MKGINSISSLENDNVYHIVNINIADNVLSSVKNYHSYFDLIEASRNEELTIDEDSVAHNHKMEDSYLII